MTVAPLSILHVAHTLSKQDTDFGSTTDADACTRAIGGTVRQRPPASRSALSAAVQLQGRRSRASIFSYRTTNARSTPSAGIDLNNDGRRPTDAVPARTAARASRHRRDAHGGQRVSRVADPELVDLESQI